MRIHWLLPLVVALISCFAQSGETDQLATPSVTEQLNNDINRLVLSDPNRALLLITQVETLIDKNDAWQLANLYRQQADAYVALGRAQETLTAVESGIKAIAPPGNDPLKLDKKSLITLSSLYIAKADAHYLSNEFPASRESAEESLRLARASGDREQIAYGLIAVADVSDLFGQSDKALQQLMEAYQAIGKSDNKDLLGLLLSTIGNLYISLENNDLAIEYYQKAVAAYQDSNQFAVNILNFNIANALSQLDKNELALEYLDKVIQLSGTLGDQSSLAYAYYSSSEIYAHQKQWQRALDGFQRAAELADELQDTSLAFDNAISESQASAELGQFKEADDFLAQAKTYLGDEPSDLQQRNWHYINAKVAAKRGDYKSAHEHALKYAKFDHNYYLESSGKNLQRLKLNLNMQQLELEQARLEKQNALQRLDLTKVHAERERYLLILLIVTLALIFTFLILYRQRQAKLALTRLATLDELTGLHNRRAARVQLEQEFRRFTRYQQPFCVALFDLDYFKKFNDTYGHGMGDKILAELSKSLSKLLRSNDILSRWGGEEFLLLLPVAHLNESYKMGERLLQNARNLKLQGLPETVQVTFSMGIAEVSEQTSDIDQLINQADTAVYQAKANGRNRIETFEASNS